MSSRKPYKGELRYASNSFIGGNPNLVQWDEENWVKVDLDPEINPEDVK